MSSSVVTELNRKLNRVEQEIETRMRLYTLTDDNSPEEYQLQKEVDTLDRIHHSLVEAHRIASAYDIVANTLVEL